jgi:hypothetical protein
MQQLSQSLASFGKHVPPAAPVIGSLCDQASIVAFYVKKSLLRHENWLTASDKQS